MVLGRKEFEELKSIAQRLQTLCTLSERLAEVAGDARERFGEQLSLWAEGWLGEVERICDKMWWELFRVQNKSIPFLMTASLPWRKGESENFASCALCGKSVERLLAIRKWEKENELFYCVSCLMSAV
jgi:hypothetical protein